MVQIRWTVNEKKEEKIMSDPEPKPTYQKFKEFYDKHPDLDNGEYYAEFPTGNKSTIRSWKNRAAYVAPAPPTPPTTSNKVDSYALMQKELIASLMTQTESKATEFEGVDDKSVLLILKNRLRAIKEQKPARAGNSQILPNPKPIGQNNKKFGIDEYIVFDDVKDEIRMEIPMDVLMDPEKNRALGERK